MFYYKLRQSYNNGATSVQGNLSYSVHTHNEKIDIAIIGGGIAGLWLLNRLTAVGYSAILLSRGHFGAGQSIASQGIIHGGLKYALDGLFTGAASNAHEAKRRWKECFAGHGEIDLSHVEILAKNVLLWPSQNIYARISAMLACRLFAGRVEQLTHEQYPKPFTRVNLSAPLYQMDDCVVNTDSLLYTLSVTHKNKIRLIPEHASIVNHHDHVAIESEHKTQILTPRMCILAAGAGNEKILRDLNQRRPRMQRRPLHQLILRAPSLPRIYGHYLTGGSKPYVTLSSHYDDGSSSIVWYIGGHLAEYGIKLNKSHVLKRLAQIFYMPSLRKAELTSFQIDRAEPKQFATRRPSQPYIAASKTLPNLLTVWPVKLTLAPLLADAVCALLTKKNIAPTQASAQSKLPKHMRQWSQPKVATAPWTRMQ